MLPRLRRLHCPRLELEDARDDLQVICYPVLHLVKQHLLLAQQLVLFALRIAPLGYVLDRQQQGRVGVFFIEHPARVEQHCAPSDRRKLVLDLVGLDSAMLWNDFFEESAERRNIPLSVAQVIEQPALRVLRIRSKRLVKGPARGDHAQVPIEYDEGLAHSVDDHVCEGMPILDIAQRVVGHGEISSKSRRNSTMNSAWSARPPASDNRARPSNKMI